MVRSEETISHNFIDIYIYIYISCVCVCVCVFEIGYPSRHDGGISPAQDFSLGPGRSKVILGVLSHILNPLLTKLVRSRWLDIGVILF